MPIDPIKPKKSKKDKQMKANRKGEMKVYAGQTKKKDENTTITYAPSKSKLPKYKPRKRTTREGRRSLRKLRKNTKRRDRKH